MDVSLVAQTDDDICETCCQEVEDCSCTDEPTDAQLAVHHGYAGSVDEHWLDEDMMVRVPGQMPYRSGR